MLWKRHFTAHRCLATEMGEEQMWQMISCCSVWYWKAFRCYGGDLSIYIKDSKMEEKWSWASVQISSLLVKHRLYFFTILTSKYLFQELLFTSCSVSLVCLIRNRRFSMLKYLISDHQLAKISQSPLHTYLHQLRFWPQLFSCQWVGNEHSCEAKRVTWKLESSL